MGKMRRSGTFHRCFAATQSLLLVLASNGSNVFLCCEECSTGNAMCSGRMTDSLYYDDYAANLEASSRPESLRVRGAPGVWQEKISPAMARALPRSFLCSFHRAASSSSIPTTPHGCDTQGFRTHFIFRWIWVNLETRP